MKLLLLGTLIPTQLQKKFIEKGIRPAPADIVQEYLVKGFDDSQLFSSVEYIGAPRIAAYPKNKVLKVPHFTWEMSNIKYHQLGFFNIPVFGFLQRETNIVCEAKKWAKKNEKDDLLVVVYSLHSPFLKAAQAIKEINLKTKIALIVPDLPMYMDNYSFFKRIAKKFDMVRLNGLSKFVDKYILYSKYMAEELHLSDRNNWTVMEGLVDTNKIDLNQIEKDEGKICIYAGSLNEKYGIDKLIEAFEMINEDAQLFIYGNPAEARNLFSKKKDYNKCFYKGVLSQEEMFKVYKKATLLINPRPSSLPLSKYSCPSKTFEYMCSGTPVLMTKLLGVPEEYYDYMYTIEDESIHGFVKSLNFVLSKSKYELAQKGKKAAQFLLYNKNLKLQIKKITDFCL